VHTTPPKKCGESENKKPRRLWMRRRGGSWLLYHARLRPERDQLLRLLRHTNQCSEVFPTQGTGVSSPLQFATIGHTPPECGEEFASWNQVLLARASAADSPQCHGELCNPPVAASGSVDDFLRCGMPHQKHGAKNGACRHRPAEFCGERASHSDAKRHKPRAKSEQQPRRCTAATGWTCARVVLQWQFIRTESIAEMLSNGGESRSIR